MKYRPTITKDRKSLLLAVPMALIVTAAVFFSSRHDGGRAAAAVMPASPEKTAQVDAIRQNNPPRSAEHVLPNVSVEEREAGMAQVTEAEEARIAEAEKAENAKRAEAEKAVTEKREKASRIGSGEASYYGRRFAGRPTASGETFNPAELTAAHKTLPFGSRVRVTNVDNGRSVVVRVNDRGPYVHGRLIDVSRRAAEVLGMISRGTASVRLELLTSG